MDIELLKGAGIRDVPDSYLAKWQQDNHIEIEEVEHTTEQYTEDDDFKTLCQYYGYPEIYSNEGFHFQFMGDYLNKELFDLEIDHIHSLVKIIEFINSIGFDGEIRLSGIISNPKVGELKNAEKKITFGDEYVLYHLWRYANDFLRQQVGIRLTGKFEHTEEDGVIIEEPYEVHEPLTEKELDELKSLCNERLKERNLYKGNAKEGELLAVLYRNLEYSGIFGKEGHPTQKEYCFLYDYYVIVGKAQRIGDGYKGMIGKDKYMKVKNWITAFKTALEKDPDSVKW